MNESDLVIVSLADENAALRERVASLEAVAESYLALAREGIHALHALTVDRDRLRVQHHRLIDEYRRLRSEISAQRAA